MSISDFHFLRPLWLIALVPLLLLVLGLYRQRRRQGAWRAVCDPALMPYILTDGTGPRRRGSLLMFALAGLAAVLALAGPTWERMPTPVFRNLDALVIVLDLSRSMDAGDITPSRLERARYKIEDLLKQRKDGQTALVVYAAEAFTVTPLTDDGETIRHQLAALATDLMPGSGSRAEAGLAKALSLLQQGGVGHGQVLLLTDGTHLAAARAAADELRAAGHRLSVLGVGTEAGAPIPLAAGGFLKDAAGTIVLPRLQPEVLRALARAGGGRYQSIRADNSDLDRLLKQAVAVAGDDPGSPGDHQVERWRELGPWLLLPVLPLAALVFRRGYLLLVLLALLPLPRPAQALDWQGLWQTPDQRGQQAFRQGDMESASAYFENPEWRAAAYYKAGQYQQVLEALDGMDNAAALYNKGNALQQLGDYAAAIEAYDRALEKNPDDEDARVNREIARQKLQQQQQKQQQDSKQAGDDGQSPESGDQGKASDSEADNGGESTADSESKPGDDGDGNDNPQASGPDAENPGGQPGGSDSGSESRGSTEQSEAGSADREAGAEGSQAGRAEQSQADAEAQQANQQWLRRIPDDPGGLLRRKFLYQYRQKQPAREEDSEPW